MSYPAQNTKIKLRKLTAIEWLQSPIRLADGEPGFDTTNSIMKIGFGKKLWKDLPAIGNASPDYETPPVSVSNLSVTATNRLEYVDVTWTYPTRRSVGFQAEQIPVVLQLHAQITYGTSGLIVLPTTAVTEFITANINKIRIFPYYEVGSSVPTFNLDSSVTPPVFRYYNANIINLTGRPQIELWYSNYNPGFNKSTANLGLFSISQGPPSALPQPILTVTPTKKLRIQIIPPSRFNSQTPGDNIVTMTYSIRSIRNITNSTLFLDITLLGSETVYTTPSDASPNSTYTVVVRATNSYGLYVESSRNITTNSLINIGLPSVPTGLSASLNLGASNSSIKTVDFTFSPSTPNVADASDRQTVTYAITVTTTPSQIFTQPTPITTSPYKFSVPAFANTIYAYSIVASNTYGQSAAAVGSNFTVASIIRNGPPSVPTNLSSSFDEFPSPQTITFICSPPVTYNTLDSSDPDTTYTYAITVSRTFGGVSTSIVTNYNLGSTPTFTTAAASNNQYYYTFTVRNTHTSVSNSASSSNPGKVLVWKGRPSIPRNLTIAMSALTTILFSFTAPQYLNENTPGDGQLQRYDITIRENGNAVVTSQSIGTSLSYSYNTNIKPYTDYTFTITAFNTYGLFSSANSGTFRTGPLVEQGGPANTGTSTVTLVGPTGLTPTLTISFIASPYGNINGAIDTTAVVNSYTLTVRRANSSAPNTYLTTTDYPLGTNTTQTGIPAIANSQYTYHVVARNTYGLSTKTDYYIPPYVIGNLTPRGPPTAPTSSQIYVDTSLNPARLIIPFTPSTFSNDADHADTTPVTYSISITSSSGQVITPAANVTASPFQFSTNAIVDITYNYTITATNAYNNSTTSIAYTNIVPAAPPSVVLTSSGSSRANANPRLPPILYIDFSAPIRSNSYYIRDPDADPLTYSIALTAQPDLNSQNGTYDSDNSGLSQIFSSLVAYTDRVYSWTITATNAYVYSSTSARFTATTTSTEPYVSSLSYTSNGISFYPSACRAIYSGGLFTITDTDITNVLRTSTSVIANGSITVGTFSITGSRTSNVLTYTRNTGTGTQNLTYGASPLGTFVANSAAADFYASTPASAGRIYYMPDNTITVNINSTTYPPEDSQKSIVFQPTNGPLTYPSFYYSSLTNTSTIPTTLTNTLSLVGSPTTITRSGFTIYPSLTFRIIASATNLGDYFFPTDWSARALMSWGTIDKLINSNIINPSSNTYLLDFSTAVALYAGTISGTIQFKNLNNSNNATSLTYTGIGTSPIFIDNLSYAFSSPNLLVAQVPTLNNAVVPGSISVSEGPYSLNYYNHDTPLTSNTLLVYNGKFRSPAALSPSLQSKYSYQDSSIRYATFGFIIPANTTYYGLDLEVILSGIDGTITTSDNLNIFINGYKPIISYRFETQPSDVGGSPDFRTLQNKYKLPNTNSNYTTGWISLNNSSTQNISTGNYNNTTSPPFNGTTKLSIVGGNLIKFYGFSPNMKLDLYPEALFLYITVGTPIRSNISFQNIAYSFVSSL
jgi:hypothetical protein